MAHPGGRPPKYNNCMDFDARCELYFEECDSRELTFKVGEDENGNAILKTISNEAPYLVSGLVLKLGLTIQGLHEYGAKPEFSDIVKRCRIRIQNNLELRSIDSPKQATGCIFNLKCNHGFKETSIQELSGIDGGPIKSETALSVDAASIKAVLKELKDDI